MKIGDLVCVRLPHHSKAGHPDGVQGIIVGPKTCVAYGDSSDAWISIFIEGKIKDIHIDYIREVYKVA